MRSAAKAAMNAGYRWMESNPMTVMLVALGLGGFATAAVVGVALRGEDTRSIITRSACAADASSRECQRIKREADEERSTDDTCIAFEKVDRAGKLLRLTRCEVGEARSPSELQVAPNLGDGIGNSGSDGGEAPASGGSHPASLPGTGGDSDQPAPANPPGPRHEPSPTPGQGGSGGGSQPPTSTPPPGSPGTAPPAPAPTQPKQPIRQGVPSVLEDVGSTVKGAGEAVTALPCELQARLFGAC